MAQAIGGTANKEGEEQVEVNLRAHLSKYNVPDKVLSLLVQDSITADELSTFRTKDLDIWCDENGLRAIERRRLINAVKALPNPTASKPQVNVVKVFLGNEEKEQLAQFDDMEKNIKKMIEEINDINKKKNTNMDSIVKEINNVCDKIQIFVENLRHNSLEQVKSTHNQDSGNLAASMKSFKQLLKLVERTHATYDDYLTSVLGSGKLQPVLSKNEMEREILQCKTEYEKEKRNRVDIISKKNNIYCVKYTMKHIEKMIKNKMIKIESIPLNLGMNNNNGSMLNVRNDETEREMENPLVLAICISEYNGNNYPNLESCDQDLKVLKQLWKDKFNFTFISNDNKCVTKEDLNNKINDAKKLLLDPPNGNKFDGFIFLFCGHGMKNKIVTSDGKRVEINTIQHAFSPKNIPLLKDKPKIYIIDAGRGERELPLDERYKSDDSTQYHPLSNTIAIYGNTLGYAVMSNNSSLVQMITKEMIKSAHIQSFNQILRQTNTQYQKNQHGIEIIDMETTSPGIDLYFSVASKVRK